MGEYGEQVVAREREHTGRVGPDLLKRAEPGERAWVLPPPSPAAG